MSSEIKYALANGRHLVSWPDLAVGAIVVALEDLDPEAANVHVGDIGVVFMPGNAYEDGCGPMVRWLPSGGCCNVYVGDVEVLSTKARVAFKCASMQVRTRRRPQ